ncbi:hypothetical protein Dda3937_04388 [Dickeya dadantii 3937]|uniref:Uncharacterized protein n=1 Tax=Dickeya dadantii (strain 3937) TaxID=198628 RepID=E0SCZ2_DICD3|nr:hypothetical protein Dda3937_04388 [Dickeya dadantii 3937]
MQMRWLYYSAHPWASPFQGRRTLRSTLLPAELSLTPVTYSCKLLGIRCVAALQGSMSFALSGQRTALFNTQCVLSCNSNYFGYSDFYDRVGG